MHSLKTFINELSSKTYQSALISSLNLPGHYAIYGNDARNIMLQEARRKDQNIRCYSTCH